MPNIAVITPKPVTNFLHESLLSSVLVIPINPDVVLSEKLPEERMDRLALPFSALLLTPDVSRPALEVVADDDFECTRILADGCCESSVSPSLLSSSSLMVNVLLLPL